MESRSGPRRPGLDWDSAGGATEVVARKDGYNCDGIKRVILGYHGMREIHCITKKAENAMAPIMGGGDTGYIWPVIHV